MRPGLGRLKVIALFLSEYWFIAPFALLLRALPCRISAAEHLDWQRNGKPVRHGEVDEIGFSFFGESLLQPGHPVPIDPQVFRLDLRLGVRLLGRLSAIVRTFCSTHHAAKPPLKLI